MKTGKIDSDLHKLISRIYDPGYKGEYNPKYFFWPIRVAVYFFLIVNFHLIHKHPLFELNFINISELLFLVYIMLLFIIFERELSFRSRLSMLILDFLFITLFVYLSLSAFGIYSWLYVLYLIPVIYCSFWFHWVFTTIFVTIVSATYSYLNYYYILNVGVKYNTFYEIISLLGPTIVIFYVIAFGVSYYKRKIQGYYKDIDKKVEEQTAELEREKEYTRNLLKSSFDAIIAVDKDGYITEVNERTCELFEYNKEEIVNRAVKEFYFLGEGSRVMMKLMKSEEGSIENFQTYLLNKNGEKIPILISAAFLYDRSLNLKKELFKKKRKFPTVGYFRDIRAEEAVDNISRGITSTTNEKELLDKIVEIVAQTIKAETCSILTYYESTGRFKVITSYGMPEPLKATELFESYDEYESLIEKISSSKTTLNISNIDVSKKQPQDQNIKWEYAQKFAENSRFGDYQHFLGTPVLVQGEVYGVIRVLNKYSRNNELDKHGFTENDRKLLERISTQVSILIEKVRDKERFEAISKVGRELNEMLDVPLYKLLEIIAKEVVKGMQFKACCLRLIDGTNNLKIKACHGLKENYKGNGKYNLKIGEGVSGKVVKTGEYCKIENLQKEEKYAFRETIEKELSSMLSIPLRYRNRVIGVINCYTRRHHKFTDQEIQMMNTFAIYASTAIQNKKRMDELMALNEIGSELVKPIKIEELFDLILKRAKALSGADRTCIKVYDQRSGRIETVSSLNCKWHQNHKDDDTIMFELSEDNTLNKVIKNGKSHIISNYYEKWVGKYKTLPDMELLVDIKSCALIPIRIDNKVFGVIILESHHDDFFARDDLLVLEAFSSQAAIALKNAEFFNKFQRVTETFPKISELNIDIDKVLDNIAEIAAEVLATDVLVLYRYDEKNKEIIWPPIYKGNIKYPQYMIREVDEAEAPLLLINSGKNHYAENSQGDPIMAPGKKPRKGIPQRFILRENIVSSAGILLKVGQEIVGIMFINYRTPHKFDVDDMRIIENYASYIAIAIHNVSHFREKEVGAGLQTLGQLAAVVAHKIKNDIGTISLYTGDLLDETKAEDPQYFNLSKISEKINKIVTDIDFLMNASKLKIPEKEFVDIESFINEIVNEILLDLKTKNIKLEKKIAANLPKIKIDPTQIKMVLSNLAYNSIDAMSGGGKIIISISKSKNIVKLDWKDTGTGISAEYSVKVFQPLWTTRGRGFGLGLFLSKTIIEEHGGSISLDLNYKKGAKFIIKFPIKE